MRKDIWNRSGHQEQIKDLVQKAQHLRTICRDIRIRRIMLLFIDKQRQLCRFFMVRGICKGVMNFRMNFPQTAQRKNSFRPGEYVR